MEILFLRQAHQFIKRTDAPLKEKIREEVLKVALDPNSGQLLHGKLKGLRSHHFHFVRTEYRIAYFVKDNVMIVAIASRENFYRDLERNI